MQAGEHHRHREHRVDEVEDEHIGADQPRNTMPASGTRLRTTVFAISSGGSVATGIVRSIGCVSIAPAVSACQRRRRCRDRCARPRGTSCRAEASPRRARRSAPVRSSVRSLSTRREIGERRHRARSRKQLDARAHLIGGHRDTGASARLSRTCVGDGARIRLHARVDVVGILGEMIEARDRPRRPTADCRCRCRAARPRRR